MARNLSGRNSARQSSHQSTRKTTRKATSQSPRKSTARRNTSDDAVARVVGLGPIEPQVLYPLRVLQQLLGWGDSATRSARRAGLSIKRFGNLYFVLGSDVIEFLTSKAEL